MEQVPAITALQPHIARHILSLRDQRVMLDAELAALYGVETKVLVQAIKRNVERFPVDFMFQLTPEEWQSLRSQFVTSRGPGWSPLCALCIHRAGRGHAVIGFEQPTRHRHQH